jgi:hypothetical protein
MTTIINKGQPRGEKNHKWKGGIFMYPNHYTMKKVREEVLREANYQCQHKGPSCKTIATMVHHKDGSKTEHTKENLLAVCTMCHGYFCRGSHGGVHDGKTLQEWEKLTGLSYATVRTFFVTKTGSFKTKIKFYQAGYRGFSDNGLKAMELLVIHE